MRSTSHMVPRHGLTRRAMLASASAAMTAPAWSQDDAPSMVWTPAASMLAPAQEIYPAAWGDAIVVAGGFTVTDGELGVSDRTQLYDVASNTWRNGPTLPVARHHPHCVALGETLYVIGGFELNGDGGVWQMQSTGWMLDRDGETWRDAPSLPRPAGEAVPLALNGRIHVIGGRRPQGEANAQWNDHTDSADHFVFDPQDGEWRALRPAPTARNSAAGVVLGGKIYVVGGRRVNAGSNTENEMYDPVTDEWTTLAPMPQGQGGLAAGALDGKIVAFGGEYFRPRPGGVHPETWLYDPSRDVWEAGPPMTTPRHGLGGVTMADRVYAIGGATGVGADGTSAVVEVLSR